MSKADQIFIANCKEILSQGVWDTDLPVRPRWADGAPAHTIKRFGIVNRYDLREEFPIQTIRRMFLKNAVDELLWIWQKKSNNIHDLRLPAGGEARLSRGGDGPGRPGPLRLEA